MSQSMDLVEILMWKHMLTGFQDIFIARNSSTKKYNSYIELGHLYKNRPNPVLDGLLSGCPNLENLMVRRYPFNSTLGTLTIAVPSLQRLTIYNNTSAGYVINAPSLKYLKVEVNHKLGVCLIGNVTKLVEANIIVALPIINENPLVSITSVKHLSLELSPLEINFPTGSIFYQFVCLELYTNKKAWWNLLTHMLDSSPKLQVLKLIDDWRKGLQACGNWNQPKNVPECLLFHLETFMWKGYEWEREEETKVAKYILSNTNCLKRATFSSKPITPKERVEMVEDLNSAVRASKSCQLLTAPAQYI